MHNTIGKLSLLLILVIYGGAEVLGQNTPVYGLDGRRNVITSAVPFLAITPDSRSGALGDAGVAITPDANAVYWNPAKLAFTEKDMGFALSYTPWLKNLVPDIDLNYLSFYKRIDKFSGFGASLRYFSLGDIHFTNEFGQPLGDFRPNEFSLDAAYARKLSDEFSIGLALRYIRSNLAGNTQLSGGATTKPGNAVAGDLSFYWTKEWTLKERPLDFALGANISNIGSKITYTDERDRDFIPINLRIGTYLNFHIDEYNEIALTVDLNKMLIPTPPVYEIDTNGQPVVNPQNQLVVRSGRDPDVPVIQGMVQSFYDAPGGFKEELREINPSIGIEYWYDKQFALRAGYFYEHPTKGNRQYMTMGLGLRYNVFGIDVAYLVPTNTSRSNIVSPLQNTIRVSLLLDFNKGDINGKKDNEG